MPEEKKEHKIYKRYLAGEDGFININKVLENFWNENTFGWTCGVQLNSENEIVNNMKFYQYGIKIRFECECTNHWTRYVQAKSKFDLQMVFFHNN